MSLTKGSGVAGCGQVLDGFDPRCQRVAQARSSALLRRSRNMLVQCFMFVPTSAWQNAENARLVESFLLPLSRQLRK